VLTHPWDAATDAAEWQEWLASTDRFGVLAVNNLDPARAPLVLPTHFTLAGEELLIHLARANPVWPHLEAAAEVRLAVIGDYAHIPTYWRAKPGGRDEDGVPTSYHSTVQCVCRPTVVDDPRGKAELLAAQLADFQPAQAGRSAWTRSRGWCRRRCCCRCGSRLGQPPPRNGAESWPTSRRAGPCSQARPGSGW
jgi:transcriptional regulator